MRNLASVVTVENKQKMWQKDKICCVSFVENGYEAIVPNTVNVGDELIFIQEGSILPVKEQWEFLRKRCFSEKENGFIIKPMTMGKKENPDGTEGDRVKSWGLAVGLHEAALTEGEIRRLKAGDDVTEALEIRKYEPIEDASPKGDSKKSYPKWVKFCLSHALTRWIGRIWQKRHQNSGGGFPSELISKSDETTIQNMKSALELFSDKDVYVSAKMEGQSGTVVPVFRGKRLVSAYVCSRNNAYKNPVNNDFWNCMKKFDIIKKMKDIYKKTGEAYVIQFEQVGPGIQQNIYNFKSLKWFIYTIKDYKTKKQLPLYKMITVADMFGLETVPILNEKVRLADIMPTLDRAVAYAEKAAWSVENGQLNLNHVIADGEELWKDYFQHEGIVVRTLDYDKDNNIGCSFKVKNMSYIELGLGKIHDLCQKKLNS